MFENIDITKPIVDFEHFEASQLVDALGYGAFMLLVGMVTVFSVLILLWGCLAAFKYFMHDLPAKKGEKPEKEAVPTLQATVPSANQNDEIVAVIAAAIAMAESENSGLKFKVVSFRRK